MADELNFETRFSKSRGMFPYVAGILGAVVVVLAFMYLTGIGREALPYSACCPPWIVSNRLIAAARAKGDA